ncbi:hypothetical protein pgond44_13646 [Psychroflexus gondwanensis ACAM 44]|uniref:Uncharacterized protein n=1 Tax=Psychroflexus gondwanensis ACAM 44 TaxID=1189619 RepID=N1WS91_9FLAO|nr:hypothetical protein [Psychroflexus gondwanensis]EMY80092.1 hypothetical protein pgond44_13646 [Psychroflexus gondwanensis ACAM 44]
MKNIKLKIALTLSLVVLLFTVKSAFWLSYYIVFTDNFVENYCENTDRPELECDGKCFLSDVLDNKQTDTPKNASIFLESKLIFTTLCSETNTFTSFSITEVEHSFLYTSHYKFQLLNRSFKPPIRSV